MKSTSKEIIFHRPSLDPGLISFMRRQTALADRAKKEPLRKPFVRGR